MHICVSRDQVAVIDLSKYKRKAIVKLWHDAAGSKVLIQKNDSKKEDASIL